MDVSHSGPVRDLGRYGLHLTLQSEFERDLRRSRKSDANGSFEGFIVFARGQLRVTNLHLGSSSARAVKLQQTRKRQSYIRENSASCKIGTQGG